MNTTTLPEGTKICIVGKDGEPYPSPYPPYKIQLLYVLRYDPMQHCYWCIAPFGVIGAGLRPTGNLGWSQFFLGADTITPTDHNPDHPRPTEDDLERAHQRLLQCSGKHLIPGNLFAAPNRQITA
jgi:hypothetical protein